MTGRFRLLSLLLALSIPAATAAHVEPQDLLRAGVSLEAHDHGPYTPCPTAAQPHCVACVSALLLPAPAALSLHEQDLSETLATAGAERLHSGRHRSRPRGRSPPLS